MGGRREGRVANEGARIAAVDLGVVDMITTDAIGEPGMRTFYLQARAGGDLVTVVVEKEQVVLLAQLVLETLADLPVETDAAANPPELEDPVEPLFRAGKLSIGYDPDEDRFLLEITEFEPEIEDEDEQRPSFGARGRARERPTVGLAGTDARAVAPRRRGRRARPTHLPLLRQPDGSRGARVSGDERPSGSASLIPRALAEGRIELLGLLPNASNAAFLARCRAGDEERFAVYKPSRGETPLWDFPEGTLHRREVAAFVVAAALGWPNVPPTVLRDGPEGPGSLQLFVRFQVGEHYFTLQDERREDFRRVALFDLVVNNADRKAGHCLLGEDGRIWVIDHGVCFSDEPKLRTVIWDFLDEPIPDRGARRSPAAGRRPRRARRRPRGLGRTARARRGRRRPRAPRASAHAGAVPRAGARDPAVPMAADLSVATFPTPLGPFTVVTSGDGVVATTSGDPARLVDELVRTPRRGTAAGGAPRRRPRPGGVLRRAGPQAPHAGRPPSGEHTLRPSGLGGGRRGPLRRADDVRGRRRGGRAAARCARCRHRPGPLPDRAVRALPPRRAGGTGVGTYGDDDRRLFLLRLEGAA